MDDRHVLSGPKTRGGHVTRCLTSQDKLCGIEWNGRRVAAHGSTKNATATLTGRPTRSFAVVPEVTHRNHRSKHSIRFKIKFSQRVGIAIG
jgi:hypothetical protein